MPYFSTGWLLFNIKKRFFKTSSINVICVLSTNYYISFVSLALWLVQYSIWMLDELYSIQIPVNLKNPGFLSESRFAFWFFWPTLKHTIHGLARGTSSDFKPSSVFRNLGLQSLLQVLDYVKVKKTIRNCFNVLTHVTKMSQKG